MRPRGIFLILVLWVVDFLHVSLQISCLRKGFATSFTFVVFLTSMKFLLEKRICYKLHICNFKYPALEKDLPQDSHCNLCSGHELCECGTLNILLQKIIFHKIHIYGIHERFSCDMISFLEFHKILCIYCNCVRVRFPFDHEQRQGVISGFVL